MPVQAKSKTRPAAPPASNVRANGNGVAFDAAPNRGSSLTTARARRRRQLASKLDPERLLQVLEELRVAEQELNAARTQAEQDRARYVELFQNAPDAYLVTNTHGVIQDANAAAGTMFNVPLKSLQGKPLVVYVAAQDRSEYWGLLNRTGPAGRVETTLHMRPRQHLPIVVHLSCAPIEACNGGIEGFRWILRDFTEQRRMQWAAETYRAQLRDLASELSLAEERGRRHIASLIHDEIGQNLAVLSMRLAAFQKAVGQVVPALSLELVGIREVLAQIVRQSRTLTTELSPPMLYDLGLGAALQWLTEEKSTEALKFTFRFGKGGKSLKLPQDVAVLLFQATRELIVNVVKHARAQRATVTLSGERTGVCVKVEDNGVGFDSEDRGISSRGFGLFSVRERLHYLDGTVRITRRKPTGTRVKLVVPREAPSPASSPTPPSFLKPADDGSGSANPAADQPHISFGEQAHESYESNAHPSGR